MHAGAHDVDEHFRTAPFEANIPVMMGLMGVWNTTFLGYSSLAILPYTQALSKLAPHIQQARARPPAVRMRAQEEAADVMRMAACVHASHLATCVWHVQQACKPSFLLLLLSSSRKGNLEELLSRSAAPSAFDLYTLIGSLPMHSGTLMA